MLKNWLNLNKLQENKKLFTKQDWEEIKQAFDLFDTTGSGIIYVKDLKVVLQALGYNTDFQEVQKILQILNDSKESKSDDQVDFQKFLNVILYKISEQETDDNLMIAFKLFCDLDKNLINKQSIEKICSQLNIQISQEEIEELILMALNKKLLERTCEKRSDQQELKTDFTSQKFMLDFKQFQNTLKDN